MTGVRNSAKLKDPFSDILAYQMRRASVAMLVELTKAYSELGVRFLEAIIVRFIDENPGCSQSEIGRALGVSRPNLVPVVNSLVKLGVVERQRVDGRTNALYATADGKQLGGKIAAVNRLHEDRFFGEVSEQDRRFLHQFFSSTVGRALARSEHEDDQKFLHLKHCEP